MSWTNVAILSRPNRSSALMLALLVVCISSGQAVAQTNNYYGTSGAFSGGSWSTSPSGPYGSSFVTTGGGIANFDQDATQVGGNNSITVSGINGTANLTMSGSLGGTITNYLDGVIPITVSAGKTLNFGSQGFTSSSTAGYTKNGAGTLALIGNSYGGGFTLGGGTVLMRGVNALGAGALNINGGTIGTTASTLTLSNKYSGIYVNGNFTIGSTHAIANATGTISTSSPVDLMGADRTITIGADGEYTLFGNITNGSLTVAATSTVGKLVLSGTNTNAGGTTLTSGILVLNSDALNNSSSVIVNGGTLTMGNSGNTSDTVGTVTLSGGTIYSAGGVLTGSSYDVRSGNLNANFGGSGPLVKSTGGTVIMNGPGSSYTGGTTISAGILQWDNVNQLADAGAVLVSGGTLDVANSSDTVGSVTLSSGTITGNLGILTGSAYIVESGTISGKLAGGGVALTKSTSGTVAITSALSYTGITTINAGTLAVSILGNAGGNSGIGAAPDTMPVRLAFGGGELEYTGGSVSTNRGFTLNAGGGAIDVASGGAKLTWAGEATGIGGLTKNGSGELEFTFDNTYLGGTTINAGTLSVNNTGAGSGTGSGLVTITGGILKGTGRVGGNLNLQSGGSLAPGNSIGTLHVAGTATLAGTLSIEVSNAGGGLVDLLNGVTSLTISPGSTVNFNLLDGPLNDPAYVFANYTSRVGTFTNVQNLPAGYTINYAYLGNSIALVPVPEPASLAMLLFGALALFLFRKKRL